LFISFLVQTWAAFTARRCHLCFSPVPTVSWSRDSATAMPIGRHKTSLNGTQLTLRNVTTSDADVYECHGQNAHSSMDRRIRLVVGGRCISVTCV